MSYLSSAQKLRAAINGAGAMLTDEQALTVPLIYPRLERGRSELRHRRQGDVRRRTL